MHNIDENLGRAYIGLGEYYYSIHEYTDALINYEKAIDLQEGITIDVLLWNSNVL